jgi:hypothetical protein
MPRDFARITLRPRHRPLVRALAEAMFACSADAGPRLDALVDDVDSYVSHASRTLRVGLLVMLEVVHFAPLFLLWRFATFESLACADRADVLERMERSRFVPLTLVLAAYKAILCLLYFEHPEALAAVGYSAQRSRWTRPHGRSLALALPEAAE